MNGNWVFKKCVCGKVSSVKNEWVLNEDKSEWQLWRCTLRWFVYGESDYTVDPKNKYMVAK